jgi:NADH:ubiquinone oxidoreductase subunit F (NADH-binding)
MSAAPAGLPRLLAGLSPGRGPVGLAEHLERWGEVRSSARRAAAVAESGLQGRGGGWFPAGRKWQAVSEGRERPVVVANGAEGEPASRKDRLLLSRLPHLVLDGADLAACGVGACRVVVYAPAELAAPLGSARREREAAGLSRQPVEVAVASAAYLAGEESAVAGHLSGRFAARPLFTGLSPVFRRGVAGRPTLVHNVETLAHVALLARFGPAWFRQLGTPRSPGSALVSVSGAVGAPGVLEIALGSRLGDVLAACGGPLEPLEGVLLGGYGGAFVPGPSLADLALSEEHLRPLGASLGAGVVVALPASRCPLAVTAEVLRFLRDERSGQCGPCALGLAELAEATWRVAFSRPRRVEIGRIAALCQLVDGRGACHHPDGAVRLVRSAMSAFAGDLRRHVEAGPCGRPGAAGLLPLASRAPASGGVG